MDKAEGEKGSESVISAGAWGRLRCRCWNPKDEPGLNTVDVPDGVVECESRPY